MNERLQELVDLFLHRGCSPEQEKELFDTCLQDPQAAETVRQQLLLSLKIRQLRDEEEVPAGLRNELFRKINLIAAEETHVEKQRKPAFAWLSGFRLGWSHAMVATATAALALFFFWNSDNTSMDSGTETTMFTAVTDTFMIHSVDTVREIREVEVPVYVNRPSIAEDSNPSETPDNQIVSDDDQSQPALATLTPDQGLQPGDEAELVNARGLEVEHGSYMERYNEMVVTMDKVQLTDDDRVRY
jgi:hypothetical protein